MIMQKRGCRSTPRVLLCLSPCLSWQIILILATAAAFAASCVCSASCALAVSPIADDLENRKHPENIRYKHPLLKDILDVTYGCIVYQEQVMTICRVLAGYSYGRADIVRRAMAKKKQSVMVEEREGFVSGAAKNGIDADTANEIFDDMVGFASYAFNKSHAAAYSVLAYRTAYLRCHYYKEYMEEWL